MYIYVRLQNTWFFFANVAEQADKQPSSILKYYHW